MRVALDISSTQSGHQFRGIGFYTERLHKQLAKLAATDKHFTLVPFIKTVPDADLYHFPAFSPFFFSFPMTLVKRAVITVHDLIPLEYLEHFPPGIRGTVKWQVQRFLLKHARHLITDSCASKKAIENIVGIGASKVTAIYLAADEVFQVLKDNNMVREIIDKFNLPEKYVLYVGDMNWNKNVMFLAEVCVKLRLPLVVVGKQAVAEQIDMMHPWNAELVKFQLFAQNHSDHIRRLGFVKTQDLVALYNRATVLVHPAIAEGFGLPILEAMQCGCPVITGNRSSMIEIAGSAAAFFDPYSKKSLEDVLQGIWNDDSKRKNLAEAGKTQAKQFSWEQAAQKTLEVYRNVLHV